MFDTALPDLNLVELFRTNRYVGADRLSDANQLSVGVTSRLLDAAERAAVPVRRRFGQTYYFETPRVALPGEVPPTGSARTSSASWRSPPTRTGTRTSAWSGTRRTSAASAPGEPAVQARRAIGRQPRLPLRARRDQHRAGPAGGGRSPVPGATDRPAGLRPGRAVGGLADPPQLERVPRDVYSLRDPVQTRSTDWSVSPASSTVPAAGGCGWRPALRQQPRPERRTDTGIWLQLELSGPGQCRIGVGRFPRPRRFGDTSPGNDANQDPGPPAGRLVWELDSYAADSLFGPDLAGPRAAALLVRAAPGRRPASWPRAACCWTASPPSSTTGWC